MMIIWFGKLSGINIRATVNVVHDSGSASAFCLARSSSISRTLWVCAENGKCSSPSRQTTLEGCILQLSLVTARPFSRGSCM